MSTDPPSFDGPPKPGSAVKGSAASGSAASRAAKGGLALDPDSQSSQLAATISILPPTSGDDSDEILEACLERFAEVAPLTDRAALKQYLPDADSKTVQFVLVELIKLDMAMASETGTVPLIESYLDDVGDALSLGRVPVDLVMEEVQLRREAGEEPDHEEYKRRFPQFDEVVKQLLGVSVEVTAAVKNRAGPPELEIGSRVDDFLIIQTLGSGAFAHVYLAKQISMARLVALKVSRGTGDEPQALSQFDHPNIVRVFDQRELDEPQVHLLYMQFHPGGTLADVVKLVRRHSPSDRDGQLLLDTVDRQLLQAAQAVPERSSIRKWIRQAQWPMVIAWMGVQLARALDDAHNRGVLHRDVKPANVLLSAEGIPKLADFNVSFAGAAGRAGAAASFGGSIGYMSPEHLRAISASAMDAPVDVSEQADLYSLSILLWELWQGTRPFDVPSSPSSWSQAVSQQLEARECPLKKPDRCGTAAERALEETLRCGMNFDPADRPESGAEFAGRLKLALHPEAAKLFDPGPDTLRLQILKRSPWIFAALVMLLPNVFVMWFNFVYNSTALLGKHNVKGTNEYIPHLEEYFENLAMVVSAVCLGIGVWFFLQLTDALVQAVQRAKSDQSANAKSLSAVMYLGQNAALIGGSLWAIAGFVYPIALTSHFDALPIGEAVRFFFSLVICGGVAAIYPYFGMTLLGTLIYYPRLIKNTMQDDEFDRRFSLVVRQSERFLIASVVIPLIGATLLIFSDAEEKFVVLSAVAATAVGVLLAFYAYLSVQKNWAQMAEVLSEDHASVIPGLGTDD
ncbi:MAG: serine/threonine protein kinase [Pirellulaceae bacterium]|nr:serine/threonine protein kinase [Pirellulaceae bacterium]